MTTLTGHLRKLFAMSDTGECDSRYAFIAFDSDDMDFVDNVAQAPADEIIEARFDGSKLVGYERLLIRAFVDETIKDIALIRWVSPENYNGEDGFAEVRQAAKEMEDHKRRINEIGQTWGRVEVTPYYLVNDGEIKPGPTGFDYNRIKDKMLAQHPDKFDQHTYWHSWGGAMSGYAGLAYQNWNKAWTAGNAHVGTILHEDGHNGSCPHTSTETQEYSKKACRMGKSNSGFCVPQLVNLKQIPESLIPIAENDKTYFIVPAEVPNSDLRNNEVKGIQLVPDAGYPMVLSARKSTEQSPVGGERTRDRLYIQRAKLSGGPNVYDIGHLHEGESQDIAGKTVWYNGVLDGVIQVTIGESNEHPWPESLPPVPGEAFTTNESRIWHNDNYAHQGIDLFTLPEKGKVIGYWFTHNPLGDRRIGHIKVPSTEWFIVDGDIDPETNVAYATIYACHGREKRREGAGTLRFDGQRILFRYYTEMVGRDHQQLTPLTPVKSGDFGVWETGEFEGYVVSEYGSTTVAYHFGHGLASSLAWTPYMGHNRTQLPGSVTTGRYKQHYAIPAQTVASIDLDATLAAAERII